MRLHANFFSTSNVRAHIMLNSRIWQENVRSDGMVGTLCIGPPYNIYQELKVAWLRYARNDELKNS